MIKLEYKSKIKFVMSNDGSPMKFVDRLVYSYLVYRSRVGQGVHQVAIADAVHVVYRTVHKSLNKLLELDLVSRDGKLWAAKKPSGKTVDYFRYHKGSKEWQSMFKTIPLYMPCKKPKLSIRTHLVLSFLYMSEKENVIANTSNKYIAKSTGLTEACVASHINILVSKEVIAIKRRSGKGFAVGFFNVNDFSSWFADTSKVAEKKSSGSKDSFLETFRNCSSIKGNDLRSNSGTKHDNLQSNETESNNERHGRIDDRSTPNLQASGGLPNTIHSNGAGQLPGSDGASQLAQWFGIRDEERSDFSVDAADLPMSPPARVIEHLCPLKRAWCKTDKPCVSCIEDKRKLKLMTDED